MTEVIKAQRKAAVLAPSQLACLSKLPTINLTAGCAHECLYCYAHSYSQNPGQGRVTLYENTLDKLRDELPRKRKRPKSVYFSPHIAISTAFLRPPIIQTLKKHVRDKRVLGVLLKYYESSQTLTMHGAGTSVMMPPAPLRRQIYSLVEQIAQRHGIVTSICACKNGDLATGSCHIAGDWSPKLEAPRQQFLF